MIIKVYFENILLTFYMKYDKHIIVCNRCLLPINTDQRSTENWIISPVMKTSLNLQSSYMTAGEQSGLADYWL